MTTGAPWWQAPMKTSRRGFILGAGFVFVGLEALVLGGHVIYLFLGSFFLVDGIVYLASAVAVRRRERSGHGPGDESGERPVSFLGQAGKAEVDDLLARGEGIHAIRRVRELTGLGLIDAKRLVESLRHSSAYPRGMTNLAVWKSWWRSFRTVADGWAGAAALAFLGAGLLFNLAHGASSGWLDALVVAYMIFGGTYTVAVLVHVVVVHRRDRRSSEGSGISPSSR